MENILYLDREGLAQDIAQMKHGLEEFMSAVQTINTGVDNAPQHWKGATETAYMEQYNELRSILTKDVPNSVQGMIDFMNGFLQHMMDSDVEGASRLR